MNDLKFHKIINKIVSKPDFDAVEQLRKLKIEEFNFLATKANESYIIRKENAMLAIHHLILSEFSVDLMRKVERWACFIKYGAPVSWKVLDNDELTKSINVLYKRLDIIRWNDDEFADVFSILEDLQDDDARVNLMEYAKNHLKMN